MARQSSLLALCLLLTAAAATATPGESYGAGDLGPLVVVAGKNFPVDGISFGDLKRLYMGDPVTVNGKKLVAITYPRQSSERRGFDESVLRMSPDDIGRYWIDRKIRGLAGPPKSVESASVVVRVVNKVDGAVGFVKLNATSKDVKVLRIDGKLPRDPGYRL